MAPRTIDLAEAQRALAASRLADRLPPLGSAMQLSNVLRPPQPMRSEVSP